MSVPFRNPRYPILFSEAHPLLAILITQVFLDNIPRGEDKKLTSMRMRGVGAVIHAFFPRGNNKKLVRMRMEGAGLGEPWILPTWE